jgi:Pentapeptide repeats (8 copies)/Bacterial Ig-like domain (group 3)
MGLGPGAAYAASGNSAWQPQPNWGLDLVNHDTSGGTGNGEVNAEDPIISGNGRYVLFTSRATNLVPGTDENGSVADAIVHDRQTGQNQYADIMPNGQQPATDSSGAAISDNGQYVVFQNLDANGHYQLYLRDLQAGTTQLVSGVNGVPGNGSSFEASMSADGRYVAFVTMAPNLVPGGLANDGSEEVVFDSGTGTIQLASVRADGGRFGGYVLQAGGTQSAISGDGRYVVFAATADDPSSGDTNGQTDVYVRDLINGTTTWVSSNVPGGDDGCDMPAISRNGRYVAYRCASPVYGPEIYLTNLGTDQTTLASLDDAGNPVVNAQFPSVSPDGAYVAFTQNFTAFSPPVTVVGIRDITTGHTALLSQTAGGGCCGYTYDDGGTSFSDNDQWVTFTDYSGGMVSPFGVTGQQNGNAFVRPLPFNAPNSSYSPVSATTTTISSSVNPSAAGVHVTYTATVSPAPDGGTVAFTDNGTPVAGCGAQPVNTTTGQATCQTTPNAAEADNIVATFSGSSEFVGSTSATLTQIVTSTPCPSLAGCNLHGLNLTGAQLSGADLSNANLNGANLTGADLSAADLSGANLNKADLAGADLAGADVAGANFNKVTWSDTTCPDGTNSDADGGTCTGHF